MRQWRQAKKGSKAARTLIVAKRTRVACALAGALAALGVQVLATAPVAAASGTTGWVIGEGAQLGDTFGMIAWGAGPAAHGGLVFTVPGQPTHVAKVTCLVVVGNDAIATGIFTEPASVKGQRTVMEAVDNGGASKDLLRFSFTGFITPDLATDPGERCWRPVLPPTGIETGSILVGTY
jgi:hypothetical protein